MKGLRIFLTVLTVLALGGGGFYVYQTKKTEDVNPPQIEASEDEIAVSIHATDEELLKPVKAYDEEEGEVSESLLIEEIKMDAAYPTEENRFLITYAAFDSSGNSSEMTLPLRYTDYEKPKFTLEQPLMFSEGGAVNVLQYFTAEDVLDGDITPFVTIDGAEKLADNPAAGVYNCVLGVINSVGDNVSLPVKVYITESSYSDSMKPTIVLTDYLIYLKKGDYFEPISYLDHVEDGGYCQIDYGEMVRKVDKNGRYVTDDMGNPVYVTQQVAEGSKEKWVNISQITSDGTVDTSRKGVYTIRYNYTSLSTTYTSDTILLVVVE